MKEYDEIYYLLKMLQRKLRDVRNDLRRSPDGTLVVQKKGIYPVYLRAKGSGSEYTRKGIGKKPALITALAHKTYLLEYKRRLEINIRALERALAASESLDPAALLKEMPRNYSLLDRASVLHGIAASDLKWPVPVREDIYPAAVSTRTDEDPAAWAAAPYKENTMNLDQKKHMTSRGVLCRSKSELALLEIYDELGIFYHYDEVLSFDGRYLSPDIIGCRSDGSLIFHEHLGLHEEAYLSRCREKEAVYARFGIIPGRNLIRTYDDEEGRLNLRLAREIIRDAFRLN